MGRVLTVADLQDMQRVIFVSKTPPLWVLDQEALAQMHKDLQLRYSILLKFRKNGGHTAGTHRGKSHLSEQGNKFYHNIVIGTSLTPEFANFTLWHEIAHAKQTELFEDKTGKSPRDFDHEYNRWGRHSRGYETNPYEVSANKFADLKQHIKLISRKDVA